MFMPAGLVVEVDGGTTAVTAAHDDSVTGLVPKLIDAVEVHRQKRVEHLALPIS
jgi:hypothetical protein